MSEPQENATGAELLLLEPEIVAWLDDYRTREREEPEDDGPPPAA